MMKEYFRRANPTQPQRHQKVPKDGPGPRGLPDCYYTSRSNRATFRYVHFINKLRSLEEEQRKGAAIKLKEFKDHQDCEFFMRCDRKNLINAVARRVDICLEAYEEDLQKKRERLIALLALEEERDIRKFVVQAQEGIKQAWQEKLDRLAFLLDKRRKEHEEKFKDTPFSKCSHIQPLLFEMRAKEAQMIQKFQMKEKQAKKMTEMELDNMWHELAMKESDALAARLEYDAIEQKRRATECKLHSDMCREEANKKRDRDREYLKQETLYYKELWDADNKREDEEKHRKEVVTRNLGKEQRDAIKENIELRRVQQEKESRANKVWSDLTAAGLRAEADQQLIVKRKEVELDKANKILMCQRDAMKQRDETVDKLIEQEREKLQRILDEKRCNAKRKLMDNADKCYKTVQEQIKEKEDNVVGKKKEADEAQYRMDLKKQIDQLVDYKKKSCLEASKRYATDLKEQLAYKQLLQERENAEAIDQTRKAKEATVDYDQAINEMSKREKFSDIQHPFMRKMKQGLKMPEKCPCSKPDYCK